MKKRSILLTCIVAVMALAMFVGCDNAPVFPDMPKSVKSGYIVQTGDFLEGQAFDASKFSVVAVLDDGSEKTVTGTTVTGAPVITTGTKLAAVAGYNMDGEQVYAEGTATAYNTDSLTITGPASVTLSAYKELDESDFTVTATYLATNSDGTKESRTMQLATGEINLEGVKYANDVAPTASNPTVSATATISTEMGGYISETYTFEVTYEAPVAELPGPVVGIKSIAYKTGTGEKPAIVAMDDVYPSFDDFDICLDIEGYVGDEDGYKLPADPGIELSYVDSKKQDLNGDLSGLVSGDKVYIKAEFEGYVAYTASAREVTIPTVSFSTSSDFTDNKIITGSELTVPELEDLVVELSYSNNSNTTYIVADPSDVSYVFQDQNNEIITTAPETAGSVVYLKAVYRGVASTQLLPVGTTVAPATVDSIEVTLKADVKGPNKQVYTDASDIPAAETVVASVAINWSDETKQVLDGNFAAWGITFEYVTNPAGSALAIEDGGLDLSVYNGLYVKATYAYAAGEEPITIVSDTAVALQTAYATGISVDVIYDNDPEITEPKYGAIVTYKVYSVNEYGIVAELDSYKIRNSSEALPTNVDSTEHAYTIVVENLQTATGTTIATADITVEAGYGYHEIGSIKVEINKETAGNLLIDSPIPTSGSAYSISGVTTYGEAVDPKVERIESVNTEIAAVNTGVYAIVSYVDVDGETKTTRVAVDSFNGNAYAEVTSAATLKYADEPITNLVHGKPYSLSGFSVNDSSIIKHGTTVVTVTNVGVMRANGVYDIGNSFTASSSEGAYYFTITYTDSNLNKTATVTIPVSVSAN